MPIQTAALAALLLALSGAARADALDAVRDTLRGLPGKTPLHVTLERKIDVDQKGKARVQGGASVEVSAGPAGLTLNYAADQLARAAAEKQDTDMEQPRPVSRALATLDATEIAAALNSAASLLYDLDGAKLVKDSAVTLRGAPARLLELEVAVRLGKADQKHLDNASSSLKLWLGDDGLPLASEKQSVVKGSFMLIGFTASEFQSRSFARRADHLVTLREEKRTESSGFGESARDQRVTTVQLPP